ncbi:MAG: hypothetical protein KC897_03790 [Candidatus Omnitrophica bacterium]|nr:hypothetical protein [Candidatus Omnitrophota bacterium]MCB9721679.1 hypothetical protein [Candidatus Omnitrophota bacterium]
MVLDVRNFIRILVMTVLIAGLGSGTVSALDSNEILPGPWIEIRPAGSSSAGPLACFGGREISIPAVISCASEPCPALTARLIQLSSALETAPLEEIHIELEPGPIPYPLTFQIPAVRRQTPFIVRFGRLDNNAVHLLPESDITVEAYPDTILDAFKPWSRQVQLRVADRDGILDGFLTRYDIAHEDIRVPAREPLPKVVFAVNTGDRTFRRERFIQTGQTTVIFHEQSEPLARVSVSDTAVGRVIDVHIKLIDRLAADPRAQQMFAEIIQMTIP